MTTRRCIFIFWQKGVWSPIGGPDNSQPKTFALVVGLLLLALGLDCQTYRCGMVTRQLSIIFTALVSGNTNIQSTYLCDCRWRHCGIGVKCQFRTMFEAAYIVFHCNGPRLTQKLEFNLH
ncbi:uncharacterized protein Dyak_GE28952, isoform A [Drosophila yakuba]|uniref:Uncharacterized protein, isoform A n=1 Tax=Drosophila yakuba TaxID=7245 RepID=A0A0R1DZW9_DROYA|nr:uncharacterized protein Dyak_GE28952, isoform A [Drosophila yakuba]